MSPFKSSDGQRELGGVDLIQFFVAVIIIGIAAATAAFSIFIGRGALDSEWRKKRALEIARDEVEYWSGMIYEGVNGVAVPITLKDISIEREVILDPRGEGDEDDIVCEVMREPLELNIIQPGTNDIENYLIKVHVIWQEPSDNPNVTFPMDTVSLQAWMIYRNSISGGTGSGTPPGGP
jgi:hypothetical protein